MVSLRIKPVGMKVTTQNHTLVIKWMRVKKQTNTQTKNPSFSITWKRTHIYKIMTNA